MPGLVLLDLNLPYWSGFEVLEWIRQQPQLRRLPVVVFTSSSRPDDIARAYDAGANGYLVKPNALADLTNLVLALREFWLRHNQFPKALGGSGHQPRLLDGAGAPLRGANSVWGHGTGASGPHHQLPPHPGPLLLGGGEGGRQGLPMVLPPPPAEGERAGVHCH